MTEQEIQNLLEKISIASAFCKKDMQEEWINKTYNIALRINESQDETDIKNLRAFGHVARIVLDVENSANWVDSIKNYITYTWRKNGNVSVVGVYLLTYMKRGLEIVENSFDTFHKRDEALAKAIQDEKNTREEVKSEEKRRRKEKKKKKEKNNR